MLEDVSSMKFRHWIIAGSVPLYIGRMARFRAGFNASMIAFLLKANAASKTTTAAHRAAVESVW
ncbi:hypothetical protein SAMN05443245_2136 [Paraburkholderia fungorum]|uniref:Uncharacterized protein n=1 Tax=Paraburkholderia fungorum TaxID=134537 RepID=A0A1H1CHG0_9BURK|nr:hypothetical protein SAMN05443245_2136 [Paraburkholderia fungorum]